MEKIQNQIDIHQIAREVAKHLGATHQVAPGREPTYWIADVSLPDGGGFYFRLESSSNSHRIRIGGHWPENSKGERYIPREAERPSITVAADRDPAAIAKDINRRFLPAYRAAYAEQKKQADGASIYYQKTAEGLARLAPGEKPRHDGNAVLYLDDVYVSIHVSGEQANLDLHSLRIEQAEQVIALVKSFVK